MAPEFLVSVSGGRSCHSKEECFHRESTFVCEILRLVDNVIADKLFCLQIQVIMLFATCYFISDCAGVRHPICYLLNCSLCCNLLNVSIDEELQFPWGITTLIIPEDIAFILFYFFNGFNFFLT